MEYETIEQFFLETSQPDNLPQVVQQVDDFVDFHYKEQRKIVLVTSGGTTVPLEKNTVRFLDNFSGGGRGSASAEYFLANNYAVIFLTRRHSLQPFARHFLLQSHGHNILELLHPSNSDPDRLEIDKDVSKEISGFLLKYKQVMSERMLLKIEFVTLQEYLFFLKSISISLQKLKHNALIYSAAAVSDFYLPENQIAVHKIQSSNGPLHLLLEPVPKMLKAVVRDWAPNSFVVSFKLETDQKILESKCLGSLLKYSQHIVVGNLLSSHKNMVTIYEKSRQFWGNENTHESSLENISLPAFILKKDHEEDDLERFIIPFLCQRHQEFVDSILN